MANRPNIQRYTKFLEVLPKNGYNITKSALEVGFSKHTAETQQKRIMNNALKIKAQNVIAEADPNRPVKEQKKTMAELVGISKESLMDNIKFLAEQERDLATRLKVVRALAREYEVKLDEDETTKVNVPVLNVTMSAPKGSTEPLIDTPTPDTPSN